jgi:hypothetical protein
LLGIKKNGAYTLNPDSSSWLPDGCQMVAAGKVSIVKDSIVKDRVVEGSENGNQDFDLEDDENVDNCVDNSKLEYLGGTLGKGVVLLTDAQREALLDKLGFDAFNHYINRLSTFIIEKKATVKNHYGTILKWAEEDRMI